MGDLVTSVLLDEEHIDINFRTVKPAKIFSEAKVITNIIQEVKSKVITDESCLPEQNVPVTS